MSATNRETEFRAAMSMLAGPSPSPDWQQVTAIIDETAEAGDADAIERRALLECRGVLRDANVTKALDSLTAAAERGSRSAAQQLILLADDHYDAADPPKCDWREVRTRIPLAQRVEAAADAGQMLSASPIVHAIPVFASPAECRWLIDVAAPRLGRAGVYNNPTGLDPGRTNQSALFNFANSNVVVELIRQRIANQLRAPLACLEMSQALHYAVGQEFVLHCDFLDPQAMRGEIARNGQRVATFLIYLNEDYDGGETSFPKLGLNHRGQTGDALVFGSVDAGRIPDPRSQHAGCPPTQGEKWVFSQWVRDRLPGRG